MLKRVIKLSCCGVGFGFVSGYTFGNLLFSPSGFKRAHCAENYIWTLEYHKLTEDLEKHSIHIKNLPDVKSAYAYVKLNKLEKSNSIKKILDDKKLAEFEKLLNICSSQINFCRKQEDFGYQDTLFEAIKWLEEWANTEDAFSRTMWDNFLMAYWEFCEPNLVRYVVNNCHKYIRFLILLKNPYLDYSDIKIWLKKTNFNIGKSSSQMEFIDWTNTNISDPEKIVKILREQNIKVYSQFDKIIYSQDYDYVASCVNSNNYSYIIKNNLISKSPNQIFLFKMIYSNILQELNKYAQTYNFLNGYNHPQILRDNDKIMKCYDKFETTKYGKLARNAIKPDEYSYYYHFLNIFIQNKNIPLISYMLTQILPYNLNMLTDSIEFALNVEGCEEIIDMLVKHARKYDMEKLVKKYEDTNQKEHIKSNLMVIKAHLAKLDLYGE